MNETLVKLGSIIKEKRTKAGLSLESFACKIGINKAYYSSIENGMYNLSVLQLKKIATGLDIKISQLLKDL